MSTNEGSNPSSPIIAHPSTRRSSRLLQLGIFFVLVVFCLMASFIGQLATSPYTDLRTFFSLTLLFGWFLLAVWFLLLIAFLIMPVVRKEQIVEEWSLLIQGGNDHASEIVNQTRQLIVSSKAPQVSMEEKSFAPGFLRGAMGDSRPFLVITNRTNSNLELYKMYLNARNYGNNLQVSWYVIRSPSILQILLRLSLFVPGIDLFTIPLFIIMYVIKMGQTGIGDLDFFDLQDIKAYVTNAHHCVLDAVDKLLLALSQDPSKIERKSRGFLGIS